MLKKDDVLSLNEFTAVSPVDGRYAKQTAILRNYFSEFALMRQRLKLEVEYFIALIPILPQLAPLRKNKKIHRFMRGLVVNFKLKDAQAIKAFEKITNHDVKSVEYFLKEKLKAAGWGEYVEFVHFGLTSQDVDSPSRTSLFQNALFEVFHPLACKLMDAVQNLEEKWQEIPMLAHTHGQPASPTKLGKEMGVFSTRLHKEAYNEVEISAKFGGATGNMNAHFLAYPEIDWNKFAKDFLAQFELHRDYPTTQIEHYDSLATTINSIMRFNTILIDFSRDMWLYISMGYFKQEPKKGEVGSSAMPHKVNPIDFENAEGNLMFANVMWQHLANTLPISRLQRDLSGSTLIRNLGVPMAHNLIVFNSLIRGIGKISVNEQKIAEDLRNNWVVVSEAIQTILRREGYDGAYEIVKDFVRTGMPIGEDEMLGLISSMDLPTHISSQLMEITPFNYVGR